MNLRAMPRHDMHTIRIQPRSGKTCQKVVFCGWAAMRAEYLSTIFRNIRKKLTMTKIVMSSSHHSFRDGIVRYALIPLIVMITPGIPQKAAAI